MAGNGVRIRLKFQDAGILSKQQIDKGLAHCWHLVRFDEVRTIADVASEICSIFNLEQSCPGGLGLEVDEFVLPPSEPAHLLKDSDLVRIRRRKDTAIKAAAEVPRGVRSDQQFMINGFRYVSHGGLEPRAIDEFEKETGGYKSEEEEGEMETDISLDGGGRALRGPQVTPLFLKDFDRSGKKRKRARDPVTDRGKKNRNSINGLDLEGKKEKSKANKVSRRAGLKLLALDDELGGYESEEEEDQDEEETDFSLGGTKTVVPFEVRPSGTPKEVKRRAKKEKASKKEDLDIVDNDQMQQLKSAVNDVEEEHEKGPKKKRKKTTEINISRPTGDSVELGPVKDKKKKSSKRAEKTEALQNKEDNSDAQPESSRKKRFKEKDKSDVASPTFDSWMDLEDALMDGDIHEDTRSKEDVAAEGEATNFSTPVKDSKGAPTEEEHRPSRSARRKKAKRKWLREQKTKMAEMSTEEDVVKVKPSNEEVVEVETLETVEILQPVVVRAGHIRFEPYEEDSPGNPPPSSLIINLGEQVKSKRQGQNWGQEKYAEKQKGKWRSKESENEAWPEVNDHRNGTSKPEDRAHDVELESLPFLLDVPQEGDVIAYRLVELTTSWTPELSPFRVGVVVSLDKKDDGIKLAPHPDYPFPPTKDSQLEDGVAQESEAYPLPYDEDGFLETELSALVDLRLLAKKLGANCGLEYETVRQNAEDEGCANPENGLSSVPSIHESGEPKRSSGTNDAQVERETLVVIDGSGQNAPHDVMSTKASDDKEETEKDAASSPEWQTVLTKELQRKKLEIRQKIANAGTASAKTRKSKYLRNAGVGSIVALLRAQQAL